MHVKTIPFWSSRTRIRYTISKERIQYACCYSYFYASFKKVTFANYMTKSLPIILFHFNLFPSNNYYFVNILPSAYFVAISKIRLALQFLDVLIIIPFSITQTYFWNLFVIVTLVFSYSPMYIFFINVLNFLKDEAKYKHQKEMKVLSSNKLKS